MWSYLAPFPTEKVTLSPAFSDAKDGSLHMLSVEHKVRCQRLIAQSRVIGWHALSAETMVHVIYRKWTEQTQSVNVAGLNRHFP